MQKPFLCFATNASEATTAYYKRVCVRVRATPARNY